MTCYSVQPRDQIFIKGYGFLLLAGNIGKNIGKYESKVKLIILNNLLQMHLKLLQKE